MTPTVWLVGALGISAAVLAGGVAIKHGVEVRGAREEGKAIGTGNAATSALEAATKTAEAERQASDEVGTVPADRAAIIALCKRSASCKERRALK